LTIRASSAASVSISFATPKFEHSKPSSCPICARYRWTRRWCPSSTESLWAIRGDSWSATVSENSLETRFAPRYPGSISVFNSSRPPAHTPSSARRARLTALPGQRER
jgi:hypothetical protein